MLKFRDVLIKVSFGFKIRPLVKFRTNFAKETLIFGSLNRKEILYFDKRDI